jgi:hypothetical protein
MRAVLALTSSKAFLATLALAGGVSIGALTTMAASGSRPAAAPGNVADVAPAAAFSAGESTTDAGLGSTIDEAVDAAVGQVAGQPLAAKAAAGRIGLRRLLIGKTERAEIRIATDAGTKTILYVKGQIGAVSGSSITINLSDGRHETFTIDSATLVREKGKPITPAGLQTGEKAMVFGLRNADGSYTARLIRCVTRAAKPAAPSQPAPSPSGS